MTRTTRIVVLALVAIGWLWEALDLPPLFGPFVGLGIFVLGALMIHGTEMERRFTAIDAKLNALLEAHEQSTRE